MPFDFPCRERKAREMCLPLAVALVSAFGSRTVYANDLRVSEVVWTSGVAERQFKDKLRSGAEVSEIFFWTLLKGGARSLEDLRARGKLPIVHEWSYSSSLVFDASRDEPEQEKVLPAGTVEERRGGLAATVLERGEFRWRTWSHKQSLWPGTWVVKVKYADGEPVPCDAEKCSWSFLVR